MAQIGPWASKGQFRTNLSTFYNVTEVQGKKGHALTNYTQGYNKKFLRY